MIDRGLIAERLMNKIDFTQSDCWEWTASKTHGYGNFTVPGRKTSRAHRIVYELLVGPIPTGLTIDHLCRNRGCVNPEHLEPVTNRENILRGEGMAAKHARKTHCPQGHPYSGDNLRVTRGKRSCKICDAAKFKRWRERQKEKARGRPNP